MRRGFTLLELMVAIFILALSATVLMGTQNTSMRMMGYANNTAIVTMLTRAKMQDLEYEVQQTIAKEGISDKYSEGLSGDFDEEGYPDIAWEALIQSIEIDDKAANVFVEDVTNQLFGVGDQEGTLSGNTTVTQFLPAMVGYLPAILNQLGKRIRKITLKTSWDYLGVKQELTVSQFITVLEVDAASGASGSSVTASEDDSLEGGTAESGDGKSSAGRPSGDNKQGGGGVGRGKNESSKGGSK